MSDEKILRMQDEIRKINLKYLSKEYIQENRESVIDDKAKFWRQLSNLRNKGRMIDHMV